MTSRRYVQGPFGQVHLREAGTSGDPPMMLLHMSPLSAREFDEVMAPLAETGRFVVAPDYPGYGESDPVPGGAPTVEHYAQSCWTVADALGLGRLDFVGHHTGSKVATEMAYRRPSDVAALVLISVGVMTTEERAAASADYEPVPLDEAGTRYAKLWDLIVRHRGPGQTMEMAGTAFAEALRGGEAYEAGHHAAFAYNDVFKKRARALDHPVTVLNPKDDLWAITPRAEHLFRNVRLRSFPDWGHGFLDAYPQEAARAIVDALA